MASRPKRYHHEELALRLAGLEAEPVASRHPPPRPRSVCGRLRQDPLSAIFTANPLKVVLCKFGSELKLQGSGKLSLLIFITGGGGRELQR
jgi:hypothetical protein